MRLDYTPQNRAERRILRAAKMARYKAAQRREAAKRRRRALGCRG